jgi:hypothetical protein
MMFLYFVSLLFFSQKPYEIFSPSPPKKSGRPAGRPDLSTDIRCPLSTISQKVFKAVTPAKAGVQNGLKHLDSGFRRNDKFDGIPHSAFRIQCLKALCPVKAIVTFGLASLHA